MKERVNAAKHGSRRMYAKPHSCRCELCVTSYRDYQRAYREKQYALGYVFNRGRLRWPSKRRTVKALDSEQPINISKEISNIGLTNENK